MKFRDRFIRFMYGRYGSDELNKFLTVSFFVLWAVNIFAGNIVLYSLTLGVMIWQFMRIFSRNIYARRKENDAYLKLKSKVKAYFKRVGMRIRDIGTCRYRTCPKCRATLRLPRRRGKHSAKCPRCGNEFPVRIFF